MQFVFSFHKILLNRDCAAKIIAKLCEVRYVPRTSAVAV